MPSRSQTDRDRIIQLTPKEMLEICRVAVIVNDDHMLEVAYKVAMCMCLNIIVDFAKHIFLVPLDD